MEQLTIINQEGQLYVNSRDIAAMVEKRHDHLIRDISGYVKILHQSTAPNFGVSDFFAESSYQDKTGRTLPCYLLTKKGCDMVANKMTGQKGVLFTAAYVSKFEEMEKELLRIQFKPDSYMIEDPVARAQRWIEEEQERQRLLEENTELKPKAELAEHLMKSEDTINMNDMAKLVCKNGFKIGRNKLFAFLRSHDVLMNDNQPYQRYMSWFEVVEQTFDTGYDVKINFKLLVTTKGQAGIIRMIQKEWERGVKIG